jgi:glutamine synthetase
MRRPRTAAHRLADVPAALENSAWARDALGQEFLGVYLAVKRAEYRQFMAEVGEQDWRWYLTEA